DMPVYMSHSLYYPFLIYATPTTKTSPLSLHDALPIYEEHRKPHGTARPCRPQAANNKGEAGRTQAHLARLLSLRRGRRALRGHSDRKSTRLNSSHVSISYAVFCLKKKTEVNCNLLPFH